MIVNVRWLKAHGLIVYSLLFYVLAVSFDIFSSRHIPQGCFETNPFLRDSAYQFIPIHAVVQYSFQFLSYLLVIAPAYLSLRRYSELVAQWTFAGVLIYFGMGSYFAAVQNVLLRFGWYVP